MSDAGSRPFGVRFGSAAGRWVLAATVLGSGMAQLDATVVNVALPAIGQDLNAEVGGLQLVVSAYSVTLAALILLSGSLGDRLGRKRVFVVGVAWFTVASAICAVAPNAEMLIAARALQGIGGALLTPGSLAIIQSVFMPTDRAKAIGAWSALGGVAAAIGPLLGGYLVQAINWRAIFLINVPLGCLVAWLAVRHVPESRDPSAAGHLDYAGATTATAGLAGVTYAVVGGPNRGWDSPVVLAAGVLGGIALVAFVAIERRSANPMLPLGIFSSRQFTSANAVTFVVYTALGGVFFLLVVVLQTGLGYSPVAAGAATLPVTAIMLALSSASGALAQRIGPRLPLTIGPLVIAAGMVLMTRIGPGASYSTVVLPAVVVFGLGLAATVAPVTAAALAAADERHAGVASGVNNAVARTAGLLAVALLPPLSGLTGDAFRSPAAITAGFHSAMLISAGLAALGGALAFATISNDLLAEEPDEEPPSHHYHCALAEVPAGERGRAEHGGEFIE
ncbi:MFS transporter [Mycolicibacterium mucogenicum]|uniref:MFS transporter n=1 Tax=Mycolicibacterium mucogenicum TaxID=56689 RepID=A0A1A3HDR3_MYCMU|nr:DHA2 family efflux MFS transporter permease subunit [Mycolicibacterium mucogenicum]OBJ45814.1 MFS transporter [Mycolicibacterium mucogenicum]